ncbi:hypothetical protein AMK19_12485 [Kitasatospora sp. CB01950]|nr:hypothetical protein AMK19_12485 [Kitasatospora sp. CB01950]
MLATCRSALDRARRSGRPVLASWAKPVAPADPLTVWGRGRRETRRSLLWQSAWDHGAVVGVGTAHDLRGHGETRVESVGEAWTSLARDAVTGGTAVASLPAGDGPLAIGGFAFSPDTGPQQGRLPDALMWVPALQLRSRVADPGAADRTGPAELTLNAALSADSDPEQVAAELAGLADRCLLGAADGVPRPAPRTAARTGTDLGTVTGTEIPAADDWKQLVRDATGRIRDGDFEKVVLARELRVTASAPFDVPAVVGRLRAANPGTTLFVVDHGDVTFLGATPEYLVRIDGRTVHVLGLAGTTPRGATPEQDDALERELLGSPKLQHEHDVVVQMLLDALRHHCHDVAAETPPAVVKLANVQHLSTKVHGLLADDSGTGILDLVDRLHPTPALGGHPRREALSWLAENEGIDRSWYAGVVGWADRSGRGEFAVAIRSALLDGDSASLYAGCGLVADSDPEAEYAETCAKLHPMMYALEVR